MPKHSVSIAIATLQQALKALQNGDLPSALALSAKAVAVLPQNGGAHAVRGACLMRPLA